MNKRVFYGLVIAVFAIAGIFVVAGKLHHEKVLIPLNFNAGPPSPTPCITPNPNSGSDANLVCKGCGTAFTHGGNSLNSAAQLACCPDGFHLGPQDVNGRLTCKKDP